MAIQNRHHMRVARHKRVRRRITGTSDRPRLAVFKSSSNIYAQVIDDGEGRTLASASTLDKELKSSLSGVKPVEAAGRVGKLVAERAKAKGLESVTFDRGGFPYKGRVKALAEAAREAGLDF